MVLRDLPTHTCFCCVPHGPDLPLHFLHGTFSQSDSWTPSFADLFLHHFRRHFGHCSDCTRGSCVVSDLVADHHFLSLSPFDGQRWPKSHLSALCTFRTRQAKIDGLHLLALLPRFRLVRRPHSQPRDSRSTHSLLRLLASLPVPLAWSRVHLFFPSWHNTSCDFVCVLLVRVPRVQPASVELVLLSCSPTSLSFACLSPLLLLLLPLPALPLRYLQVHPRAGIWMHSTDTGIQRVTAEASSSPQTVAARSQFRTGRWVSHMF